MTSHSSGRARLERRKNVGVVIMNDGKMNCLNRPMRDIDMVAHDLRAGSGAHDEALDPDDYRAAQALAAELRAKGSDGIVWPSRRQRGGECVALFYPDCAARPVQGRHLGYHWNGARVDFYRDATTSDVFRIGDDPE